MDDNQNIDSLREALKLSPDNIPLRHHLAEVLLKANRLDEAQTEFAELVRQSTDVKYKYGLAKTYFQKGDYSLCNVILEDVVQSNLATFDVLVLHARALLREKSLSAAVSVYQRALTINPNFTDEELDGQLRLSGSANDTDGADAEVDDNDFLQRPTINFNDVGGMANVKKEIDLKIIKPLLHPELYKAYGKKIGGGILLYGPPGCGKTFIAKATAGQVNARFISVSLNDILDMWVGNSEKNLHRIFEKARQNTPCVLFFDEIDALGANRTDMKQSSSRHLINQFLQELDGVDNSNDGILVIGATNTPWHLDPAFRRPGRFDRIVFVPPPDDEAREGIFRIKLKDKPVENIDYVQLSKKLENFSGADIEAVIDLAIEEKLESAFVDGVPKPISTKDLLNAAKKHRASTQEWFATAKNFALFANESGIYDDILTHMKLKK